MNQENMLLDAVHSKILRYLPKVAKGYVKTENAYRLTFESTAIFIRPFSVWDDKNVLVEFSSYLLRDLEPSPALYERLVELSTQLWIGKPRYYPKSDDKLLILTHFLLGDTMDEEEFVTTTDLLIRSGDEWDDKLRSEFGGKRWIDG